jgi:hypothetical protein
MLILDATMEEKAVLSHLFQKEEKGHSEQLFHTRVIVQERACALTIDQTALINAVSSELVEKLELPLQPIPEPYFLRLGDIKMVITHQTVVQFLLGKLSFAVLCDVLPIHMISCHLLLGRPWYKDQGASYHMDNYCYTKYVLSYGKKTYILLSMDTITYKAWRDEKLQQLKEVEAKVKKQKEAKKREAEAAILLSEHLERIETRAESAAAISVVDNPKVSDQYFPIDVLLIDSKPRTVLPQEGEDDKEAPIYTPTNYVVTPRVIQEIVQPKNYAKHHGMFSWTHAPSNYMQASGSSHELTTRRHHYVYEKEKETCAYRFHQVGHISYYFGSPRPPEQQKVTRIRNISTWDFACLQEIGWGPP